MPNNAELRANRLSILIVGFYFHPEPTGIAPYTTGLARDLVARGHNVRVIVDYPHYPAWKVAEGYHGLRRRELIDGVEVIRVRHPVPRNSTGLGRIAMEAIYAAHAATIRGRRPDVVLAVSPALLAVATALTWSRPGRTAMGVIVQDLYGRALTETEAFDGRGGRAAARLEGALLSQADGVVVIHEKFREPVIGLGVEPDKVSVIRNWSHITEPTGDRHSVRARLGWRENEVIALHAGNMGHKQGLDNIVEAARLADFLAQPIRFVLLGDGSRRYALQKLGAGLRRLQFIDPLPDGEFENALAAADVLVLTERPGITEMCVPSKLTSYFAAGRPVVAATDPRSGAAAEVRASRAGVCVNSGQPNLLLEVALLIGSDPANAAVLGSYGRAYALKHHSQASALDAYSAWIDQLTRGRTTAAKDSPRSPGLRETDHVRSPPPPEKRGGCAEYLTVRSRKFHEHDPTTAISTDLQKRLRNAAQQEVVYQRRRYPGFKRSAR